MTYKNLYTDVSGYPERKWACRFCRHDLAHHNNIVGCPHCRCAGTQGECRPASDADFDAAILPVGVYLPTYEPKPKPVKPSNPKIAFRIKSQPGLNQCYSTVFESLEQLLAEGAQSGIAFVKRGTAPYILEHTVLGLPRQNWVEIGELD